MQEPQFTRIIDLLKSGKAQQAESMCRQVLQLERDNVNILALLGAIFLKSDRLDEAISMLNRAIELAPAFAKPQQDLAVLYMQQKQYSLAEGSFNRLTELDPQSISAWFGLAHALKNQNKSDKARAACDQLLNLDPAHVGAMRLLSIIATEAGQTSVAERLLRHIIRITPDAIQAHTDLARYYIEHQRFTEAADLFQHSAKLCPSDAGIQLELARALSITGQVKAALKAYEIALDLDPNSAKGRMGQASSMRSLGEINRAIQCYETCIDQEIEVCESYWNLSSIRNYQFSDKQLDSMQHLLARLKHSSRNDDANRVFLNFAIAKAMDDRHAFDSAWKHYARGNKLKRAQVYFDSVALESEIQVIKRVFDMPEFKALVTASPLEEPADANPIFIVGMPRSGSTLIEQILASHQKVEGAGELPYLLGIGKQAFKTPSERINPPVTQYTTHQLSQLRNQYMQATERHRVFKRAFFTDKAPDNFLFIGLISLLMPSAKIIDARRHPLDTCVGNFRQLYAQGKGFSYDLTELGEYYLQYINIMSYWEELFPQKILRVQYEKLIENTHDEVSRLLEFCGLDWDENCLNFYQTPRTIATASAEQVRQPIYTNAIGYWKNYQANLAELNEILAHQL